MYLVNTKSGIFYVVNSLNQFMGQPKKAQWAAAKHVLKYLRGTVEHGLKYIRENDIRLSGFTDTDWEGSSIDRKSKYHMVLFQYWIRNDLLVQ